MLFFNSRARNGPMPTAGGADRSYTQKMGHSCIIIGCICLVSGLIVIVIGVISDIRQTTYIGIGVVGLAIGFFLTTLVCFYGKLDICYNNWAYRSRVVPISIETPRPLSTGGIQNGSPFTYPPVTPPAPLPPVKRQPSISVAVPTPFTTVSDIDANRIVLPQSNNALTVAAAAYPAGKLT